MSKTGYTLVRDPGNIQPGTMKSALSGLARRGHDIKSIIDIGASDGRWSSGASEFFPGASFLLVEAQAMHESGLLDFCQSHKSADYVIAVAGESRGSIHFDASDPFGGIASATAFSDNDVELPVTTIDHEVASRSMPRPFLIKFDTHGYELPILNGATETLKNTDVIVMECYNYRITEGCLLFDEMCRHMKTLGFRCIDMVDPMYRPYDHTFWQMDLVFVRSDRFEFDYVKYC